MSNLIRVAIVLVFCLAFSSASLSIGAETSIPEAASYHTYQTLVQDLDQLAAAHPDIAKVYNIGTTYDGKRIAAIKISDNASSDTDEHENKVLFVGNHHAREWISVEVPYLLAKYLVEHYNDPGTKSLIDNEEIWVVPLLNSDGKNYTNTTDRNWRKNRQPYPEVSASCIGVDLNRNYGSSTWGIVTFGPLGSVTTSDDCADDTYMGPPGPPYGFSEAETQAIRDFFSSHRVDAVLSYHSYSQLILWPWGYTKDPIDDWSDRLFMEALGKDMSGQVQAVHGQKYTAQQSSDLYPASGDLTDWSYETYGIPSFTIELRPSCNLLDIITI